MLIFCLISKFASQTLASLPTTLDADAAVQAAQEAFYKGDYPRALSALTPALERHPKDPGVLNLKGAILTKENDYTQARICYEAALKEAPDFFPAIYNIGSLLALEGQLESATTYFRNLLIEQPNNELLQYKLLLLLLRRNVEPDLQRKLFPSETPSNTPGWYFASAARSYKNGNYAEAAKYLDVAKSVYGDKVEIFQEELDESGLKEMKK